MQTSTAPSIPKMQASLPGGGVAPAPEDVKLTTEDGYVLAGRLFEAREPLATVVIHSATSVPAGYYTAFAEYLATRGFAVLTYDYRGVGRSRPKRLQDLVADKVCWGEQDMNAAFEWLGQHRPGLPRFVIGHSVGGQFHGLVRHPEDIDAIFTFGSGYGSLKRMRGYFKWQAVFLWYFLAPLLIALFGYLPSKLLGFGEDIPAAAGRQWIHWGKRANYFRSELAHREGFAQVTAPWLAWRSTDDPITTAGNAHGLHADYPSAELEERVISPAEFGHKSIGHLGFFRRTHANLWPEAAAWLLNQVPTDA